MNKLIVPVLAFVRGRSRLIDAAAVSITAAFFVLRFLLAAPAPHYRTATVTRADLQEMVLATGILQPIRQVDVGTRVTGQLKKLKVNTKTR